MGSITCTGTRNTGNHRPTQATAGSKAWCNIVVLLGAITWARESPPNALSIPEMITALFPEVTKSKLAHCTKMLQIWEGSVFISDVSMSQRTAASKPKKTPSPAAVCASTELGGFATSDSRRRSAPSLTAGGRQGRGPGSSR